ncbi:hypothetical protein [Xanthomonas medicagonis]|uniref:hypothetical protein n=1 Tax=Xanthomonas medicagonis TaxID=3160841 RepID=UPI0035123F90
MLDGKAEIVPVRRSTTLLHRNRLATSTATRQNPQSGRNAAVTRRSPCFGNGVAVTMNVTLSRLF